MSPSIGAPPPGGTTRRYSWFCRPLPGRSVQTRVTRSGWPGSATCTASWRTSPVATASAASSLNDLLTGGRRREQLLEVRASRSRGCCSGAFEAPAGTAAALTIIAFSNAADGLAMPAALAAGTGAAAPSRRW